MLEAGKPQKHYSWDKKPDSQGYVMDAFFCVTQPE